MISATSEQDSEVQEVSPGVGGGSEGTTMWPRGMREERKIMSTRLTGRKQKHFQQLPGSFSCVPCRWDRSLLSPEMEPPRG